MSVVATPALPPISENLDSAEFGQQTDLRSTITLNRVHPSDCGERQVFVRLDDGQRIALVYGDSVTVEVQPGSHRLFAHNTLFRKRLSFAIEPAEHLEFEIINSARWWTAGVVGLLGAAPLFLTVRLVGSRST
jgi:hypothetical protein